MKKQTLNGLWEYCIGGCPAETVTVPFSRLPVGRSTCRRSFDCAAAPGERVFLHFEGITYAADITLNGRALGHMLPYVPYEFEITDAVRPAGNDLTVELDDISPAFGPSEGWENYGGIIREVSLIFRRKAYITDCFFHTALTNDFQDADFTVDLQAEGEPDDILAVELIDGGRTIAAYAQRLDDVSVPHHIKGVHLWSPDDPHLYGLRVRLMREGTVMDETEQAVGFRAFTCGRHRFFLNGQPIFLRGVCRHEMIGDSGHTPKPEQIEADLRHIKSTGCNFVRLVHYPHCSETIAIADRIGLMVSEEPGLWWSDTADPAVAAGSLEVLRRTIRRDRSHPSIVFWLCFNECRFTEQFLIDSARVCRENDPTRPVSGANCMGNEDTLHYYNLCGFDFYTMHPYAQTFARAAESARILCDKPLLFSEWGGHYVYDNPKLLGEFIAEMGKLWRADSDEGALAGAIFWCWAELNDFNRRKPAVHDGVLREGLLTADRKPTMIYEPFLRAWENAMHTPDPRDTAWFAPCACLDDLAGKTAFSCAVVPDPAQLCAEACVRVHPTLGRERPRAKGLVVGPILPDAAPACLSRRPWMLRDGETLTFTASAKRASLTLFAVTLERGWPIAGEYGESAASLTVTAADGTKTALPLRNGIELTTAFTTLSSSRIDPRASAAVCAARFGFDRSYERYLLNRIDLSLPGMTEIRSVSLTSADKGYVLLIYGLFA